MRTFLFLVMAFQILFEGITLGSSAEQLREIMLIRRAYLDVAGVVPTVEEIDWFVVYNKDGYEKAIDHLFKKYNTKLIKDYLLSDGYKNQSLRALSIEELNKSLVYVVGGQMKDIITEKDVMEAKQKLIDQALKCSDNTDDAIDYMCNALMSRFSNVQENNLLSRKFRDACALGDEQRAWILVVNEIMKLPGVCHK